MDSTQDFSRLKKQLRELTNHWDNDPAMTEWVAKKSCLGKWPLANDIDLMTNKVEIEDYLKLIKQREPIVLGEAQEGELREGESYKQMAERQDQNKEASQAAQKEAAAKQARTTRTQRLDWAEGEAGAIVSETTDEDKAIHLLQDAYEEQFPGAAVISARVAKKLITEAYLNLIPKREYLRPGDAIDLTPTEWLCEGLIMRGGFNLIIGLPKVGKTALILWLLGALHRNEPSFLDKPIMGPCPPIIIVGTDQSEQQWGKALQREGWVTYVDGKPVICPASPVKALIRAGDNLVMNEAGLKEIIAVVEQHPGAVVVLDSYRSLAGPLGHEEISETWSRPARSLYCLLAPYKCTAALLHHSNKENKGGTAISASAGSTGLPAVADWSILINYLVPCPEEKDRTDFRVVINGMGRAEPHRLTGQQVGKHPDVRWMPLSDEEADTTAIELEGKEAALTHPERIKAINYLREIAEHSGGKSGCTAMELASAYNWNPNNARRMLVWLDKEGLAIKVQGLVQVGGNKRQDVYFHWEYPPGFSSRPETPKLARPLSQTFDLVHLHDLPTNPEEEKAENPLNPQNEDKGRARSELPPAGTKVERRINGTWQNSWVLIDKTTGPFNVCIQKLGNASATYTHLEWWDPEHDTGEVRLCQTVTPSDPEPAEPTYDPEDFI